MKYYDQLYVLDDDGNPLLVDDVLIFAVWWNSPGRRAVAFTEIDGVEVSTVFLGINHNYLGVGPPVLWETMIFGGSMDMMQWRYTSKERALEGHNEVVLLVKTAMEVDSCTGNEKPHS